MFSAVNEILRAVQRQFGGDQLIMVEHDEPEDPRWKGNPKRWDAPMLNLNAAREIRFEEIRIGRSMTQAEQAAHIRKLCDAPERQVEGNPWLAR